MKYLVVVNQKYIVAVEAESELGAEHKILDDIYYGITGAQAFDQKSIRTDCFYWLMQDCKTVSYEELEKMSKSYKEAQETLEQREQELKEAQKRMKELQEQMTALQTEINARNFSVNQAMLHEAVVKRELGTK